MTDIAKLIESSGLTQKAFADRFGIPLRTVEDWKAGRRKPPEYLPKLIEEILSRPSE